MDFLVHVKQMVSGKALMVVTHGNADLDAVSSGLLTCELLRHLGATSCCVLIPEGPSRDSRKALELLGIDLKLCEDEEKVDIAVVVDASNESQLGGSLGVKQYILIDHHEAGSLALKADVKLVDPEAPTCVELVLDVIRAAVFELSPQQATLAMAAMLDETGLFERASARTFEVAAYLLRSGANYEEALALVKRPKAQESLDLRLARLKGASRAKVSRACGDLVVVSTYVGSYEADVARSLVGLGADVAIAFKENRASVRVSRQALERGVSASSIAAYLAERLGGEGGGHRGAAALNLSAQVDEEKEAARAADLVVAYLSDLCRGRGHER